MASPKKKNHKKNSNYKIVHKYVNADQMCRKTLCDYRNMEEPIEYTSNTKEADAHIYNCAVDFCALTGVITEEEKAELFDGKNHVPMSVEEVSAFTGIPTYQIQKNLFAFKAKNRDEEVRASVIKLMFCEMMAARIQQAIDEKEPIDDKDMRKFASYINFCVQNGIMDEEQSTSVYFMAKENIQLSIPYILAFTGLDEETYQQIKNA